MGVDLSAAASAVPLHPARQRGEGGSALIWRLTVKPLKASAAGCLQCGPEASPAWATCLVPVPALR